MAMSQSYGRRRRSCWVNPTLQITDKNHILNYINIPLCVGNKLHLRRCPTTTTSPGVLMSVTHTSRMKAAEEDTTTALLQKNRCSHAGQNSTTSHSFIPHGDKTLVKTTQRSHKRQNRIKWAALCGSFLQMDLLITTWSMTANIRLKKLTGNVLALRYLSVYNTQEAAA